MKKPADDLFQLIKSLTQAEKRYFKVHAGKQVKGHSNKYEKLFDAYDALPDDKPYDEAAFKRSLRGKSYGKNLAQEKQYLQESLMETLRAFHAEGSIDNQLYQLLAEEDIYRQKRLNNLREKTIEKAKEIARKYEKWEVLLMLLDRELGMRVEVNQDDLLKIKAKLGKEEIEVLRKIKLWDTLKQLSYRIFIITRISTNAPTAEHLKEAEEIVNSDAVKNYKPGFSFQTDRHYYRIWAMYYRLIKDFKQHNFYTGQIYELYESRYPLQKAIAPVAYKVSIFNFLNSSHTAQDYNRFDELLGKVKSIPARSKDEEGEDWQNVVHLNLLRFLNTGAYDKGCMLYPEMVRGMGMYKLKINKSRELVLYYNMGTCFFMSKKWKEALTCFNKVINDASEARSDLRDYSKLLILIVVYELKEFSLLEYNLRNYENYFKSKHGKNDLTVIFLSHFKMLAKTTDNNKKAEMLRIISNLFHTQNAHSLLLNKIEIQLWASGRL